MLLKSAKRLPKSAANVTEVCIQFVVLSIRGRKALTQLKTGEDFACDQRCPPAAILRPFGVNRRVFLRDFLILGRKEESASKRAGDAVENVIWRRDEEEDAGSPHIHMFEFVCVFESEKVKGTEILESV